MNQRSQHKSRHTEPERRDCRKILECIGREESFRKRTLIDKTMGSIVDKWDLMKLKSFCKAKNTVKDKTAAYLMGKDFHQLHINRELISQIYKELKKKNQII